VTVPITGGNNTEVSVSRDQCPRKHQESPRVIIFVSSAQTAGNLKLWESGSVFTFTSSSMKRKLKVFGALFSGQHQKASHSDSFPNENILSDTK
jgi:hypothetical protein